MNKKGNFFKLKYFIYIRDINERISSNKAISLYLDLASLTQKSIRIKNKETELWQSEQEILLTSY